MSKETITFVAMLTLVGLLFIGAAFLFVNIATHAEIRECAARAEIMGLPYQWKLDTCWVQDERWIPLEDYACGRAK